MLAGVIVATELILIIGLIKLFYDVAAIRRMLENTGLFSGIPCDHCMMPIPPAATVCGHCGRDVEVAARRS
jgi:predicted amidophosphoribosyltransferase